MNKDLKLGCSQVEGPKDPVDRVALHIIGHPHGFPSSQAAALMRQAKLTGGRIVTAVFDDRPDKVTVTRRLIRRMRAGEFERVLSGNSSRGPEFAAQPLASGSSVITRAAIYARRACAHPADNSLRQQIDACERALELAGWHQAGVFSDDGFSGVKMGRPGLDELMSSAVKRRFEAVMVTSLDRIARRVDLVDDVVSALAWSRVRLFTLDTFDPKRPQ